MGVPFSKIGKEQLLGGVVRVCYDIKIDVTFLRCHHGKKLGHR